MFWVGIQEFEFWSDGNLFLSFGWHLSCEVSSIWRSSYLLNTEPQPVHCLCENTQNPDTVSSFFHHTNTTLIQFNCALCINVPVVNKTLKCKACCFFIFRNLDTRRRATPSGNLGFQSSRQRGRDFEKKVARVKLLHISWNLYRNLQCLIKRVKKKKISRHWDGLHFRWLKTFTNW